MSRRQATAPWLIPGRTCWALERATRYRVIPDGEEYYRLFRDAVLAAERSVFILSWDITGGTNLVPNEPPGPVPARLDAFLRYAARRRPRVKFLILTWDYGLIFTMERDPFTRWRLGWRTPGNVRLGFDDRHPVGACHHQKVVVIDDSLAFSGSMDLTSHRWDTPQHRVDDPARLDVRGRPYDPYHEVQAMLDGPVAARLGELARDRWRATGETRLPRPGDLRGDLWPDAVTPDFTNVDVGIARTVPGAGDRPAIRECETLYLDAIAGARQSIYIENQYFTHPALADALGRRLAEADGPEIVLAVPRGGDGWLDRNTITVIRDGLFRELAARDRHGRLRLVYPLASRQRDVATFIHSKVLVVDDRLLIVGSANTNRRSMGMDTECDVAVEGLQPESAAAITGIRSRLLAEHLGLDADRVTQELADDPSIARLLDRHQTGDRGLFPFDITAAPPLDETVQYVVDPDRPPSIGGDVAQLLPAADGPTGRVPLRVWISPVVALLAAIAVAWSAFPWLGHPELTSLRDVVSAIRMGDMPELIVVVGFLVAGLVLIPLELAVVATGFLLGVVRGTAVAVGGSVALAVAGYGAGRLLGPTVVGRWVTRRSYRAVQQLGAHGVTGAATLRLAGVASAGAIHLLSGASRVAFGSYLAGTMIGLLPSVFALSVLGALLGETFLRPTVGRAALTGIVALVILSSALALRMLLVVRQFEPAMARRRAQTELG